MNPENLIQDDLQLVTLHALSRGEQRKTKSVGVRRRGITGGAASLAKRTSAKASRRGKPRGQLKIDEKRLKRARSGRGQSRALRSSRAAKAARLARVGQQANYARSSQISRTSRLAAYEAGKQAARLCAGENEQSAQQLKQQLRYSLCSYYDAMTERTVDYGTVLALGEAYRSGFASEYSYPVPSFLLLPIRKRIVAVLCAYNEQDRIGDVIAQLNQLAIDDVIVVINGSTDHTYEVVRQASAHATIIHYPNKLGHDVGRAVGAKAAYADIVLFADSDILISAEQLGSFIWAVESGVDVALNDLNSFIGRFDKQDSVSHSKNWLNILLGREDLGINSLTAIPHALSSRAIAEIGYSSLCIPPKAHAIAIMSGLQVRCVQAVDVVTRNKHRETNVGKDNPMQKLILGDHVEAIKAIWDMKGDSLHEPQQVRSRIATRRNAT